MSQFNTTEQGQELDLVSLVRIMLKYKYMLLVICLICLSITAFYSIRKPHVYQGSVVMSAIETAIVSQNGDVQKIGIPASFYESLVKDSGFILKVLQSISMEKNPGNAESIAKMIRVEKDRDPRILKISFEGENKDDVKKIMEGITNILLETNTQLRKGELTRSEDYILSQKDSFERELSDIEKKLSEYQKSANLSILNQRVVDKLTLRSQYEMEYTKLINDIQSEEENLKEITKHFKNEERTYKLVRSLSDEVAFQQITSKMAKKEMSDLLTLKLESETLNPLYENLKERLINTTIALSNYQVRKTILEKETKKIVTELETLQNELIEKQNKMNKLNREYDLTKDRYKEFSQREAVTRAYAPLSIGNVSILTPVYISNEPKSIFLIRNLALSCFLGLFFGTVLSLLIEYKEEILPKIKARQ
ncbi:MAG: hypothetical protein KKH91_05085 [Elusimicrobia bacterium]|nr:hypothetical protein [Elusimicrobiota bacterium]